jgi:uncharacterized protein with GYD domain
MKFISLVRFKTKPTKASIEQNIKCLKHESSKERVKCLGYYYTLGRYDAVMILEAPDEKAVLRSSLRRGGCMSIETLVAIPAEEARKLIKK